MKKQLLIVAMVFVSTYYADEVKKQQLVSCDKSEQVWNANTSPLYQEILAKDDAFEVTYAPQPDMFAPKKAAIVTCMDYRLNNFLTAVIPGAYILRNAGGRVTEDWIRSLALLYKLLAIEEIYLIQHTDCGMQKITNRVMTELVQGSSVKATLVDNCNVTLEPMQNNNICKWINTSKCCGKKPHIDWLPIKHGLFNSVLEDVKLLRNHPLIPANIPIYGFIFDVLTGELIPVTEATEAGKAKPLSCK